jgi:hypothetical protein
MAMSCRIKCHGGAENAQLCERFIDSLGGGQNFAPSRSGVSVRGQRRLEGRARKLVRND